mmetsp:Transcript_23057/g.43891  ORF Transcript_23057/g.43891 Transcript_23057/m.43891 type:complete len:282 (-) Transcript_23057:120-965(-)|eukprot:scaffold34593_cov179-Amphora_coffeaeformis.AAC.2
MDKNPIPYSEMPFSSDLVEQFLEQAKLSKLLKDYKPSQLSQEGTKKKQKTTKNKSTNLRPQDILCGRGPHINKHPGNALMRYAILQNQKQYFDIEKRSKKICADALIGLFESWDMRFLEAVDPNDRTKHQVCSYERANEKIMQGLRQKIFKNQKHVNAFQDAPLQARKTKRSVAKKSSIQAKAAPYKVAKRNKSPKPTDRKKTTKHAAPTKVTPDKKKQRSKPKKSAATTGTTASSTEGTDKSPRCVTKVTPVHVKGTFQQPVVAPVLCLATFLRSKLEKK